MSPTSQLAPERRRGKPSEGGDFVVFEAVSCFDAHEGDDGVVYDAKLLQHIANNCNRRIQDTGDWCPVVVAHTRDADQKASVTDDPPVIGMAGPFWVGTLGKLKPRPCIFATFWIFPECESTFLRNPRRSVEIWPEERPEDRFFDPISCLGAETPKRDLGMIYSRRGSGITPMRHLVPGPLRYSKRYRGNPPLKYEATCAGGGGGNNTFIASGTNLRKQKNEKGGDDMTPEDLSQLADALKPMIQALVEDAIVATQSGEPSDSALEATESLDEGADLGGAAPPMPPKMGGMPPAGGAPPMPPMPPEMGGAPPMPPDMGGELPPDEGADLGGDELPPEGGDSEFDALEDEDKAYAKSLGRKFMKYRKDEESDTWDDDGADKFVGALDDEDTSMLDKFMKYANSCSKCRKRYAARYGKDWEDEEEAKKEGEPKKYSDDGDADDSPAQYAKARTAQKYRKLVLEHEGLKQRYAKVSSELSVATKELSELRVAERYAKRYAKLKDLESDGYVLEPAEEMEMTEDMTDDQFDRHVKIVVPQRYSRVTGSAFPVERERKQQVGNDKPQKYAKAAREAVEKYRKQGRELNYGAVLKHLIENDGQVNEPALLSNGNGKH